MAIREEIVVATKVHGQMADAPNRKGLSRKHIFDACEASLKRLNMDYIDLYQIHRFDPNTPIGNEKTHLAIANHFRFFVFLEETMEALNDLVRSGKVVFS